MCNLISYIQLFFKDYPMKCKKLKKTCKDWKGENKIHFSIENMVMYIENPKQFPKDGTKLSNRIVYTHNT
jgi:hypothetical protein